MQSNSELQGQKFIVLIDLGLAEEVLVFDLFFAQVCCCGYTGVRRVVADALQHYRFAHLVADPRTHSARRLHSYDPLAPSIHTFLRHVGLVSVWIEDRINFHRRGVGGHPTDIRPLH